jgi:hypothetical protein
VVCECHRGYFRIFKEDVGERVDDGLEGGRARFGPLAALMDAGRTSEGGSLCILWSCLDIVERSPKKPRHHDRVAVDTGLS